MTFVTGFPSLLGTVGKAYNVPQFFLKNYFQDLQDLFPSQV